MLDSLEYKIAKGRIENYEHETDAVVRASAEAQDCLECEAFLEKGIVACQALQVLETVVRDAIVEGHLQPTEETKSCIQALYAAWHKQSQRAENWIAKHVQNGYDIKNLAEFQECCEHVHDWLERKDWLGRAAKTRQRFAEELW